MEGESLFAGSEFVVNEYRLMLNNTLRLFPIWPHETVVILTLSLTTTNMLKRQVLPRDTYIGKHIFPR